MYFHTQGKKDHSLQKPWGDGTPNDVAIAIHDKGTGYKNDRKIEGKQNKTNKTIGSVFLDCSSGKGKETLNAINFSDPVSEWLYKNQNKCGIKVE